MTDREWQTCTDPFPMLHFVRLRASPRKLRLFACACCRLVWDHLDDDARRVVELGERYADGEVGNEEVEQARRAFNRAIAFRRGYQTRLAQAAESVIRPRFEPWLAAARARTGLHYQVRIPPCQCDLLRDVIGDPSRRIRVNPLWLEWNGGTVRRTAEGIYRERRFTDLPVLADALEEAGCDVPAILDHLRGKGPHARGCWALDLLVERCRADLPRSHRQQ